MLEAYKKKFHKNNFQYILVDDSGCILESDETILPVKKNDLLQNSHPFFEILSSLLLIENERFDFSCINLNFEDLLFITDVTIHSQNKNENLVIIEDLTKHYSNYQLAAQTRNESIINSQVLELKNEYLLEKETFKNNFIANFSHQLRNPITASLIFSKLLLKNNQLNDEQKNYLGIVLSSNKDLKDRIENILDISKIQSGKLKLVDKVFNFKEILKDIVSAYKILASNKSLKFNISIDERLPDYLRGDSARLKQVIENLLSNAITFTNHGSIDLKVSLNYIRARKANIQIEVIDTGCGIPPNKLDFIFERFTKIESTIENENTAGLGLSITEHIISEMNGNITVESTINEGTKFKCNISINESLFNDSLKQELLKNQLPHLGVKRNILLVEDSELMQLTLLKILAATGDFYLNIISKGEELIPNITSQEVDLILLANTIHDYSVVDLATSVRNLSKEHKKTPIILLSTEAFQEDLKRFKKAGINAVITKPFDEKKLLDSIYKHIK
ncbi:hybrid sensor histidine kinase/response regulator [Algibacter sp. L1A34]|uniref:ATP-binding response regulator n=1 Tax=Algibacter sp. L1A34 TaxID=2686365 RepID=UPI00131ADD39|nr:ATP-binding protein [Algibacter sp. L1A34]